MNDRPTSFAAIVAASEALARATRAGHCRLVPATRTCATCGITWMVAGPGPIPCGACLLRANGRAAAA